MYEAKKPMHKLSVGWKEWCALPALQIPAIKAKIDTGAKTASIHAFNIEQYSEGGTPHVRFDLHPLQGTDVIGCSASAPVIDEREIMSATGHTEHRYVIETMLTLSGQSWPIELSLTARHAMRFRLLLGRDSLQDRVIIDPAAEYLSWEMTREALAELYTNP